MTPSIDGSIHTVAEHGLYDGLFLLRDDETETFWDHMTGEAVYGPLVGRALEIANLRQTTAGQILAEDPDALIAVSDHERVEARDERVSLSGLLSRVGRGLSAMFSETVAEEDVRRPTMDLGLGVWSGDAAVYYPYDLVVDADRAVMDIFEGERILVYLDPAAYALAAIRLDAESVQWEGDVLRISNGSYIEDGVLRTASGESVRPDRPLQVFTRWYGFSLTFPDTEIYGDRR
jgi:hypothetical protein